jgi:y4mF family transcriptional regulator
MQSRRSPLAEQIGRLIRDARHAQNLPQEELALAAGVSTRTISSIERGALGVQLNTLLRILSVLGMTLEVRPTPAHRTTLEPDPPRHLG